MLIVLTGIDGSGKTTAARALVSSARAGDPAVAGDPELAGGGKGLLLSNHAGRRHLSLLADRMNLQLPPRVSDAIETTIRLFNVLVNHARASRFDGLVVMDRHLHCQLALRDANGLPRGRLLPWLLTKLPAPDLLIHFDADPAIAHERVTARGTDRETLADLRAFRDAYRSLPELSDALVVDASGTPEAVHAQVMDLLQTRRGLASPSRGNNDGAGQRRS
ncbi:thymidylate kinase [Paenarthrobacter ilicis]|uniref:thymidylate kinase n=1 Tax=Paenarthrobacter ilicis TaxID=43665 RepID=UPI003863A1C3